ncbi:unnamed protein product [Sphagnum jensenii]|uniref:Secreted protein n=1 Tax=Sphagnum jensenii TaxID=128206 RepID=A0ABP0WJG1_9BRYO
MAAAVVYPIVFVWPATVHGSGDSEASYGRCLCVFFFIPFRLTRNENGPISCIRFRAIVAILMIIPVCLRLLQRGGGAIVKSGNTNDLLLSCEWIHYQHVLRRVSVLSVGQ